MTAMVDKGSFRDPRGRVYIDAGRIFRTVTPVGIDDYAYVRDSGLYAKLIAENKLVSMSEKSAEGSAMGSGAEVLLEHSRIPFISYPYEWGFQTLKKAAIFQLDVYLEALRYETTLSDATAYNVQFIGASPIFIDHLAFRRYEQGEYWMAHRQFCEQFLNPLLLRAKLGIPHNAWYRGALEGISTTELNAVLPFQKKMSWNIFFHVVLQSHFQNASMQRSDRPAVTVKNNLRKASFQNLLLGLRSWISKLEPKGAGKSVWDDYANDNSYSDKGAEQKRRFIQDFVSTAHPKMVWDLGCNTGHYSQAALEAGADYVVGFDFDQGAVDKAERRAAELNLRFLPLVLDATNPTPSQGWCQAERKGFIDRANCDALFALALVHHLAIAKNVPLPNVVDWLLKLAPRGVVEFVPKSDPMVVELLRLREDIFDEYNLESFQRALLEKADIVKTERVAQSERVLIWFERR